MNQLPADLMGAAAEVCTRKAWKGIEDGIGRYEVTANSRAHGVIVS